LLPSTTVAPSLSALTLVFLTGGTALCTASANALNMLIEPEHDAKMSRTRNRPLVRGLISKRGALTFAGITGIIGVGGLWFGVNPTVAFLGGLNIALYAGVYTPMKRISVVNTWIGAIVGGIPPLMGWAAAAGQSATGNGGWQELILGEENIGGWLLAALLFAWQFPHFNALSWPIREEYKNAGYRMLVWTNSRMNGRVAFRYSLLLFPICIGLTWYGVTDRGFLVTSSIVNTWMVREAWRFWRREGLKGSARGLFWASVWHLPVIMVLAMAHKKGLWEGVWRRVAGDELDDGMWISDDEDYDEDVRVADATRKDFIPIQIWGERDTTEPAAHDGSNTQDRLLREEENINAAPSAIDAGVAVETLPHDYDDDDSDSSSNLQASDLQETVVEDESEHSWRERGENDDSKKEGQSLLNLLYHIAEDQARRDGYVHRQVTCNSCNAMPIRGIRYRCANCIDFDLCEQCEAMQVHPKTHIFYKVRIPAPFPFLGNPRQPQPVWYPGKPSAAPQPLSREASKRFCKSSGLEDAEISALWDQFRCLAGTEWAEDPNKLGLAIDRRTFDKCFVPSTSTRPPPPNLIYDLMFAFYDANGDGLIGFEEFLLGLASLRTKNQDEKLKRVFRGYDLDRDGHVSRKDFLRMFRAYYALTKELARDLVAGMEEDVLEGGVAARDIVMSSQPISSAFSGPISNGEPSRTGEGKTRNENGDFVISDGNGVIVESGRDEGDHLEFIGDVRERATFGNVGPSQSDHFESMFTQGEGFGDVFRFDGPMADSNSGVDTGLLNNGQDSGEADDSETGDDDNTNSAANQEEGGTGNEEGDNQNESHQNQIGWPPPWVQEQDVETALGAYLALHDITEPNDRIKILKAAKDRVDNAEKAKRQSVRQEAIEQRWQRRHFYLNEEDGDTPPEGFSDTLNPLSADSPLTNGMAADHASKSGLDSSRRSRSSSKVRFEDDLNDEEHETRSNTSMSSRSIPLGERWGGYEIPEAEKDVGREVLYQVTQEGLNEMLDPLFKDREDLAMEVLRTKALRTRLRLQISRFATEPMQKLLQLQITEIQKAWRTGRHISQGFSTHGTDPGIVGEIRKNIALGHDSSTREYHRNQEIRSQVGLPVDSESQSPSLPPLIPLSPPSGLSAPLQSNPVDPPQNDPPSQASGTDGVEHDRLAEDGELSLPSPRINDNGSNHPEGSAYPQPAVELHAAVTAFNEADPSLEENILQKPLDDLLQESGYSIAGQTATKPSLSSPNPDIPDCTLPQNRPNA
ncbi:MAG: hypothetical protein Q9187_007295, partial [Circinaria calcarea]